MSAETIQSETGPIIGFRVMALNLAVTVGLTFAVTAIFGKPSVLDLLRQGEPWPVQVAWGIAMALLVSLSLKVLVDHVAWFGAYRRQMMELAGRFDLSGLNPLWFSLCAGVGEELLFRGALQPLAGLWASSLVFTALHYQTGGFRTMNWSKALYALCVLMASLGLGILSVRVGLIASIVTHTVADIVGLLSLRADRRTVANG